MNVIEWNPSFGPITSTTVILGAGIYFYFLFRHLVPRHGSRTTWLLLLPKTLIVGLLVLALLDPSLKLTGGNATPAKVLVLQDISSSMDLTDDGSSTRNDRASRLLRNLEADAPGTIKFVTLPFDTSLHEQGYVPKNGGDRGTNLGAAFMALDSRSDLADADGVIVLTDGGDETIELSSLPSLPLAIIGVGASPDSWSDIGIGAVTVPASVEENSQFDLQADLYARPGKHGDLSSIKVSLDENHDGKWIEVQSQTVDISALHAAANFHIQAKGTGSLRYRVRLPQLSGELTYANNTRTVNVQVQQRALHVLYFTQELGVDYKYLRTELGADPGIIFTAMYRVLEDQFTVQGDRTGFQDLAQGFPNQDEILKRYDCIILGSFVASQFNAVQMQALVRYVENGGALVLLGGSSSFGRGGYADTPIAPLIPWAIRKDEPDLATGSFPVTVSPSGSAVEFTDGLREDIGTAGGVSVDSLNRPGGLRPGALGLLNATLPDHAEPLVAWQRYGKGQVLGIATNTLWKWASAGHETRALYGRFWRQSVRGLTRKLEGGSLLGIHWNEDHYRPGEQAVVEVQLREAAAAGNIRLVGSIKTPSSTKDVSLIPVTGQAGIYTAKIPLAERGDYMFHLSAYSGTTLAESYERLLPVEPMVEEGANPELKEAYLREIAKQAKGVYAEERNLAPIKAFLREQVSSQQGSAPVSLVNFRNIFPILILLLLLAEWTLRRRFNLI